MVRRLTPAQARSQARQAQNKYNAAVRKYNAEVKKVVDTHNSNVRKTQRAVDNYNREVRAHNARVRTHRARLQSETTRLRSQTVATRYETVRASSLALTESYQRVDASTEAGLVDDASLDLVDLAEGEAANSARLANLLTGNAEAETGTEDTALDDELSALSPDLDRRWRGALFALDPRNPDAARHFCTSSREVLVQMIDLRASDADVLAAKPDCQKTDKGAPIRREKIDYLLSLHADSSVALGEFVDDDVNDVMKLFRTFNDGTHGSAGAFDLLTLRGLKLRVEGAIRFLSRVVRGA